MVLWSRKIVSPSDPIHDRNVKRVVTYFFNKDHYTKPKKVKNTQIIAITKKLKPFKASGPENILNILLKNLPDEAITYLTQQYIKTGSLSTM